jgi:tetratricopeptide (TPR) repeat protein
MKKNILAKLLIILAFAASNIAFAKQSSELNSQIEQIQKDWAISKYQSENKDQKIEGYRDCAKKAQTLTISYPDSAESLIWQGICLASEAELTKLSALGKVKEAKRLFEKAAEINDKALDGSAYTNLAVLYHRVPSWPIAFGDREIARKYFKKVLEISPNNIDANYFYALFLEGEDNKLALEHLNLALKAPSRNRPLADSERKKSILQKIKEIEG